MLGFLKKKQFTDPPEVDIHSHLIPGVDDGVQSFEESIEIIRAFKKLGYRKLITTPHIMADFYPNKENDLKKIHNDLVSKLAELKLEIDVDLAAEYYLDDALNERIGNPNESFLTFGDNYLLFETSFMNEPFQLKEFVFKALSRGLKPVMAHPERYMYFVNNEEMIDDLSERGVRFQVNINSLNGYYSKHAKRLAEKLISKGLVNFIGSDCHNHKHLENLSKSFSENSFNKVMQLPLLNNSI